jgi:hypothetical protein
MPDPINAPVEAMKGADPQPPAKLVVRDTGIEKLLTYDDAMAAAGDARDPLLNRVAMPASASLRAWPAI